MRTSVPLLILLVSIFIFFNFLFIGIESYPDVQQADAFRINTWRRLEETVAYVYVVEGVIPADTSNGTDPYYYTRVDNSLVAVYFPLVDKFSVLNINVHPTGYSLTNNTAANGTSSSSNFTLNDILFYNTLDVYIWLNITGHISPPRYYKNENVTGSFVGYFTGIVNMVNGNITSVTWDDNNCKECLDYSCIGGLNCGYSYISDADSCNTNSTSSNDNDPDFCNIQVYLAWVGTDNADNTCTSFSYAPSQFSQYSALSIASTAAGIATKNYYGGS